MAYLRPNYVNSFASFTFTHSEVLIGNRSVWSWRILNIYINIAANLILHEVRLLNILRVYSRLSECPDEINA